MNLVTPEELAELKATYLSWGEFQRNDEDCAQDYREPETDPYFRLICTLEYYMAAKTKQKMNCPCVDCPKAGDVLVCAGDPPCPHTVLVLKDCTCTDMSCVCHACCGVEMKKVN